jgi:biotin-dependent carboxylase-like uncharacterized protein
MTLGLKVIAPGMMTTLQDLGRRGYQSLGVPVSGALDALSLQAANAIVGNAPGAGGLEIAYQGPTLRVTAESVRLAFAGGAAAIEVIAEGATRRLPMQQSARLTKGQVVRIGAPVGSAVLYLAVEGGFDVAPVLGSLSTYRRAALGGFAGRALRAGDELPLKQTRAEEREERTLTGLHLAPPPRFRIVFGPQDDYFTPSAMRTLVENAYTVTPAADRMGMRLAGPLLEHAKGYNIVSDGIAPGAIQVPGNGLPIVLLADRQTTGGYPKIATVVSADLPALGRLTPGAKVAFTAVDIEAAEAAHRQLHAEIAALPQRIVGVRARVNLDGAKLLEANLVSGMVDAHDWPPGGG